MSKTKPNPNQKIAQVLLDLTVYHLFFNDPKVQALDAAGGEHREEMVNLMLAKAAEARKLCDDIVAELQKQQDELPENLVTVTALIINGVVKALYERIANGPGAIQGTDDRGEEGVRREAQQADGTEHAGPRGGD